MNSVIEMLNGIIENNPGYSDILGINDKEKKRKSSHRTSSQSPSSDESSTDNEKRSSRRKTRKSRYAVLFYTRLFFLWTAIIVT